jgi:tricorn protease
MTTLLTALSAHAVEAPLPRHPAPSPDASTVAFSWQGDLWTVDAAGGAARRLTAHPAAERHPVWSADGRWLAFASDRYGNLDVFVLPADGSAAPRRLTHASVDDVPLDFTPDGGSVLFASRRAESVRRLAGLYLVPVDGGTPRLAQPALGLDAAYGPDGISLAFVRGDTDWTRSRYRGAANRDLWLHTADDEYVQLTDFDGDDDCPSWIDAHSLVFLSSRSGRKNVFVLDLVSGGARQLTTHQGTDVRRPRASADGSLVAYEFEDDIWLLAPAGGEPRRLRIDVPHDQVTNPLRRHRASSGAEDLAVSPDGRLAAFVIHGDVFVTALTTKEDQEIATPPTVRITDTPEREADLSWSPDGTALLFASGRAGPMDLFLARPADGGSWTESFVFPVERLTADPADDRQGRFSPDGAHVAFVRGKGDLMVLDLEGSEPRTLLEHWDTPAFRWSPDGEWLAYSVVDPHYNAEVWVVPVAGGNAYNVSRHPDDDLDPRWSPDGRRLLWISKRHADTFDVWGAWLRRADHERTPAEWLELFNGGGDDGQSDDDGDGGGNEAAELPDVLIDLDGLWERATAITDLTGDEGFGIVSPDGKRVVFSADHQGERDLYSVRWDGDDLQRLTEGGQEPSSVQIGTGDDPTLYYLDEGGRIQRIGLDGTDGDPAPFLARYEVDVVTERGVVFDEAWRALDQWFYDPEFHGVDWHAQREVYRPWALAASHDRDFEDVMNLMLGELNASHMRYRPPAGETEGEVTGFIGAVFDPGAGGPGLLVREVLRDTPAARHDVGLQPGERLLAVTGHEIGPSTNVYSLLTDTVKTRVSLRLLGADGNERRAVVVPVSYGQHRQRRYETWVRERRAMVDRRSGGRLGYIHIQGMNIRSFEDFERNLHAAAHGREGLIIDVRSNGGGWTTDYLMAVLDVRRHAFTVPRDADPTERAYPQSRLPLAAWTRPALTLCNEESYSNAEIFSWAFQELERGLLVGSPTFGAVISTGGQRLLNGGWVRLPLRGWYVAGSGTNMENNGARPDVVVWQPPAEDTSSERDTQLERAVAVFLDGLEDDPRYGAW